VSAVQADFDASPADGLFDWPLFGLQDDVRPALAEARARGVRAVLATLYGVVGAAPRGVGAQMVFVEDGVVGFLSGGCIEADLSVHAQRALADNKSEQVTYGEGGPMDIRLPCGSRIDVLLEPLAKDDVAVARLLQLERERRPALWLTNGDQRVCVSATGAEHRPAALRSVSALAASRDQICDYLQAPFAMFRAFAPRRRLMVIGADPIALAVVKLAVEMGFETILVRPRGPETCPLPGIQYDRSDAQAAISASRPDAWTAIAILTHDVDQEHSALTAALATNAGYVGVLGSRRRAPERISRLAASGVPDSDIKRMHAPIGLPIGGKSPWEIAVSVIAEIVRDLEAVRLFQQSR
jgi:xanthine dehydrogenase accessory factor